MLGKLLRFGRPDPARGGTLTLHTADWSAADLPDAPSADRILALYEERFGHPVRATRETATTGAPQLAIDIDVSDLPSLDRTLRRFWAGELARDDEDKAVWRAMRDRLKRAEDMHARLAPMVHFPFSAAAVIAYMDMAHAAMPFSTLIGYRALEPGETHGRDMRADAPPPSGALPPDRFEEGGHLFRFRVTMTRFSETLVEDWTVLIGPTGIHRSKAEDPRASGILSMLDMRRHDLPGFLKPEPAFDRTEPPPESRLSITFYRRHDSRTIEERIADLERELDTPLHGEDGKPGMTAHVDLSDLPDWPEARDRLWAGVDVTDHLDTLRTAMRRFQPLIDKAGKHPRLTETAALIVCLSQVWKGGSADALRLAAQHTIHPYVLEKMSFDQYPSAPRPPPEGPVPRLSPEPWPSDFGLGCLFEIDGRIEKAWFAP